MAYNFCIFDLDGTLTDPFEGVTNGFIHALRELGIDAVPDDPAKYIGPPLFESFKEIGGLSDTDTLKAVDKFREYYADKGLYENKVYPGILDLLKRLHSSNVSLAVATTKYEKYACKVLEHFGIMQYLGFVSGDSYDGSLSRGGKKLIIENALNAVDPKRGKSAVMIGDRFHDICGGRDAGIDSIGITWGYGSFSELQDAGAAYIADTPGYLFELITVR